MMTFYGRQELKDRCLWELLWDGFTYRYAIPPEASLPTWLSYLVHCIASNLPPGTKTKWMVELIESIPVGANVNEEKLWSKICVWTMGLVAYSTKDTAVIDLARQMHQRILDRDFCFTKSEWNKINDVSDKDVLAVVLSAACVRPGLNDPEDMITAAARLCTRVSGKKQAWSKACEAAQALHSDLSLVAAHAAIGEVSVEMSSGAVRMATAAVDAIGVALDMSDDKKEEDIWRDVSNMMLHLFED